MTKAEIYLRIIPKIASHALICDKKALPSPWPSLAPLTRPAMSTTVRNAGTLLYVKRKRHILN